MQFRRMACCGPPEASHDEVRWIAWLWPWYLSVPLSTPQQAREMACWVCGQQGRTLSGE